MNMTEHPPAGEPAPAEDPQADETEAGYRDSLEEQAYEQADPSAGDDSSDDDDD
jgi:hypothetical protein